MIALCVLAALVTLFVLARRRKATKSQGATLAETVTLAPTPEPNGPRRRRWRGHGGSM